MDGEERRAQPAILTEGLTKDYGSHRALDGLSLRVEQGEIFGFLGPNGAGKTTTIRLLLDLIRPTAGRARVLGYDCQRQSRTVRSLTGYLPGDLRLYPGLRGHETVELVAGLRTRPVDRARVRALAGRLDLDLGRHVGTYSKGNRQKLGILLALLDRPPVLLLDEPTSGLDPLVQRTVWEILREEAEAGTAVFFSSHVMSEVEHTCQRVAILRAGRLVTVAPVAALVGRSLRRLEVTFGEDVPPDAFALTDVRELRRANRTVWLETQGDLDPVVRALARYHVVDLRTEQPSLEEILLTYYQQEAAPV
jgi:ABC-2 type transport system ATP-binding protein